MADELGVSIDQLRDLVTARYVPRGTPVGEWSRPTLEAFLPLWEKKQKRRHYTACRCSLALELLSGRPGVIGRCGECGTMYLVDGLWLRSGEVVRYFNE